MSYPDLVVYVASREADEKVSWPRNKDRILDYFTVSTGKSWEKKSALQISWCSYFVHWVLVKAGLYPLPMAGTASELTSTDANGKQQSMGSIGRFIKSKGGCYNAYPADGKAYKPKAGDMYYLPTPNNHIGLIERVSGDYIYTIDGNSGPKDWTKANDPLGQANDYDASNLIGKGMIFRPPSPKKLNGSQFYIELPD